MQNRIFIFFLFLFWEMGIVNAQDFTPGHQAQGYLNGKNVTVDYATGTFHYKVPLYTLGNGGFSLPISADYAAKGVKLEDHWILLGNNWTLNTGGIVSRTVRGGIADEEFNCGYSWAEYAREPVPLADDRKKVNLHQRDGECDIFTAVFNGRSVSFIIRMTADHQIYAEPLEQTDVRIECEASRGEVINGWVITDETGNRYIYRQKEWTSDVCLEEAVSFNGIRNKSYISSWYLSRIEPANASPVIFTYCTEVYKTGEQADILKSFLGNGYFSKYIYGFPMSEHTFDFQKYKKDFDIQIALARDYLQGYSWEQQIDNPLHIYIENGVWARNPNFESGVNAISNNFRIMGQLANFESIGSASNELIQVLNNLYNTYRNSSSTNARIAASCFNNAKSYVIKSLEDRNNNITEREISSRNSFVVRSPKLDNIYCSDKILKFKYGKLHSEYLTNLKLCALSGQRVSEICFGPVLSEGVQQIKFMDRDSIEIRRLAFEYYQCPSGSYKTGYDLWGYPKPITVQDDYYNSEIDSAFMKTNSLKSITLPDGGRIHLDYEPNYVTNSYSMDSLNSRRGILQGGIRLKSVIFEEPSSLRSDTICYRYPLPGFLVYHKARFSESIKYGGFSDEILHSRMKYDGPAFLNTGNNGVYYRYVHEVMAGRGTQAYLFHVPFVNTDDRWNEFYPFWLYALPLGVASYDKNGNLKRLVKNKYITKGQFDNPYLDISSFANRDYFTADDRFLYDRCLPQMKAYDYYLDADYLSNYYRNQGNIVLYTNGNYIYYISPYNEVYVRNIEPRTTVIVPDLSYSFYYGGKTLLQRRSEYHFNDIVTALPDISDFSKESSGILFNQTDYFYDHPEGTLSATRIVTTDSRGDVYTTLKNRSVICLMMLILP